jgi:hypothetical protein
MVKLADVCWINKLQSPILICDKSDPIAFCTSVVIKWHPREGAVMDSSCWKNFMLIPVVSEDVVDWDKVLVVGQEVVWTTTEGRKQATAGKSKEMRETRNKCFMTIYDDNNQNKTGLSSPWKNDERPCPIISWSSERKRCYSSLVAIFRSWSFVSLWTWVSPSLLYLG